MKYCLSLIAFLSTINLDAQNLVPNPGFESFHQCPPYPGQIHEAQDWDSPNNTTSDYFHSCSPFDAGASVPTNLFGFQEAAEGQAYAGIRTWIPSGNQGLVYREYLSTRLIDTLKAGHPYLVSFKVSLAEESTHTSDDIGIYFSDTSFSNQRLYPFQPQISNKSSSLILDTDKWTSISGTYIAKGGEQYIVIGNFLDDQKMTRVPRSNISTGSQMVYYYIDDILIEACEPLPSPFDLGPDTSICTGEMINIQLEEYWEAIRWADGAMLREYPIDQAGNYQVQLSFGGCTYQDSMNVSAITFPEINIKDTTICEGEYLNLQLNDTTGIMFNWSNGETSPLFSTNIPGTYSLIRKMAHCEDIQSFQLRIDSIPQITISDKDTFICNGQSISIGESTPGATFKWENGYEDPIRIISKAGNYTLTTIGSCYNTQTNYNIEEQDCDCSLFIPNIITPNGDGINDAFQIISEDKPDLFNLQIFDRWGKKVFSSNSIDRIWEVQSNKQTLITGSYFWTINYQCRETIISRSGQVLLLR